MLRGPADPIDHLLVVNIFSERNKGDEMIVCIQFFATVYLRSPNLFYAH
jgi:hypothetical protein